MPRVTLVTRKAYGGAYIAMNSRSLGATRVFAWPGAEVAVMGAVAAVRILHRRKLAAVPPEQLHEVETELAAEHEAIAGGLRPRGRDRRRRRDHRARPDPPARWPRAIAAAPQLARARTATSRCSSPRAGTRGHSPGRDQSVVGR